MWCSLARSNPNWNNFSWTFFFFRSPRKAIYAEASSFSLFVMHSFVHAVDNQTILPLINNKWNVFRMFDKEWNGFLEKLFKHRHRNTRNENEIFMEQENTWKICFQTEYWIPWHASHFTFYMFIFYHKIHLNAYYIAKMLDGLIWFDACDVRRWMVFSCLKSSYFRKFSRFSILQMLCQTKRRANQLLFMIEWKNGLCIPFSECSV